MTEQSSKADIERLMESLAEPRNDESYAVEFGELLKYVVAEPNQFSLLRNLTDGTDAFQLNGDLVAELIWRFDNRKKELAVCPDCPPKRGCIRLPWYEWGRCVYMCWPPRL